MTTAVDRMIPLGGEIGQVVDDMKSTAAETQDMGHTFVKVAVAAAGPVEMQSGVVAAADKKVLFVMAVAVARE